jgi:hypothetical protein
VRAALCILLVSACVPSQGASTGPIVAPEQRWSWVEFDDTRCANGTPTGLGINPSSGSSDVVIYLMGGGACWDSGTCFFAKTAWNIDLGYGPAQFTSERFRTIPLFDRAVSPFSDASFVYVPYCTGDLHVGTSTQTYVQGRPTHHEGAKNLDAFLTRLAPTFANAHRVFVVGTSAGGFGAQMNAWRFKAAFPSAEVHVLADSAALLTPSGTRWREWNEAWKPQRPPGCAGCEDEAEAWAAAARSSLRGGRLGLVTSEEDGLLSAFAGRTGSEFRDGTHALVTSTFETETSAAFIVPGARHVFLDQWTGVERNGVGLLQWVTAWRDGVDFTSP